MTHWVIGDVQGCHDPLARLLDAVNFDPAGDRAWFLGDLVNRGGRSLDVLRLVHGLGPAADVVLGNHDLHLLAAAAGEGKGDKDNAEFQAIFQAHDRDTLLDWLQQRPMVLLDEENRVLLVHAGLLPQWDLDTTLDCAGELERVLRGPKARRYFKHMYGNRPRGWSRKLDGHDRLRVITNAMTRMRFCDAKGRMNLKDKGPPGSQDKGLVPWFEAPNRRELGVTVLFGHWSTLGLYRGHGVMGLDTGCVWGGPLTAVDLGDLERVVQVS